MPAFLFCRNKLDGLEIPKYVPDVNRKGTSMRADFETRSLMVLQEEVTRAATTIERVRLVVQAMAQRRGLARDGRELERDAAFDFGA